MMPDIARGTLKANRRIRIVPNKCVHVKRVLQGKGSLSALKNQPVSPQDILGKSIVNKGFASINIADRLGVSIKEGEKYLQKPIGKQIFKGELLAMKKGILGKKLIIAPTDGIIDEYDSKTGELKLKFTSKEIPLAAGVYGIVDDVNHVSNEVTIKTYVTQIYGIYGVGKERGGILSIIGRDGDLLNSGKITVEMTQHILVVGALIYGDALRKAIAYGVAGIISGGLNVAEYRAMVNSLYPTLRLGSDIGLSILATEGFGPLSIGNDISVMLESYKERFVFLNGNAGLLLLPSATPDSIQSLRTIALPLTKVAPRAQELFVDDIELGIKVRIIWPPFMGIQGTIIGIDKTMTVLESGVGTILLTVQTPTQTVKVPYPNVELI